MKATVTTILCLLAFSLSTADAQSSFVHNQIIVSFIPGLSATQKDNIIDQIGFLVQGNLNVDEEVLVEIPEFSDDGDDTNDTPITVGGQVFSNVVEIITLGETLHAYIDDTDLNYFLTQDPLANGTANFGTGEYSGLTYDCHEDYQAVAGSLVNTLEGTDSRVIKVAILDTGLDSGTQGGVGLLNQFVVESANVLLDDDNPEINIGFEPYTQSNSNVNDENGHGTAVAGIVLGLSITAGLTPADVEVYIIKMFGDDGRTTLYNALQAVSMAAKKEVDLFNVSWSYMPILEDTESVMIHNVLDKYASLLGGMVVMGAGNSEADLSVEDHFPAGFDLPGNTLTVGGVDCDGHKAYFSNYGQKIDINAPSTDIVSTHLNGNWVIGYEGTSFAAPIVTAGIIQVWHEFYTNSQLNETSGTTGTTPKPIPEFGDPEYIEYNQQIISLITSTATISKHGMDIPHGGLINFSTASQQALIESPYLIEDDGGNGGGIPIIIRGLMSSGNSNVISEQDIQDTEKLMPNNQTSLSVYPNPIVQQTIHGLLKGSNIEGDATIELSTIWGKNILSRKLSIQTNGEFSIPLNASLVAGCYFLTIAYDGQLYTTRIIKD